MISARLEFTKADSALVCELTQKNKIMRHALLSMIFNSGGEVDYYAIANNALKAQAKVRND